MKLNAMKRLSRETTARNAWIAFGGLAALAVSLMTIREIPSMQREARLMRM